MTTDYWLGWNDYDDDPEFELHTPWWISGYGDDYRTMVAAVRANSEDEAWDIIQQSYDDPGIEDIDRRFIDVLEGSPFSDRFPAADWMAWTDGATCKCEVHQ